MQSNALNRLLLHDITALESRLHLIIPRTVLQSFKE